WLVIYQKYIVPPNFQFFGQFYMRRVLVENRRMVEHIYNFFFHNFLQIAKIYYHSKFYMAIIRYGLANNGYRKFITMPMHILTLAIVTIKGVPGFKRKLLCNAY